MEVCRIGLFPADVDDMITAQTQSGLVPTRKLPDCAGNSEENPLGEDSCRGRVFCTRRC